MPILLAGDFETAERQQWLALLQQALPGETWVADRSEADADALDVAIVANPPRGALQGLPRLRLIQSLWAGVDQLLADPGLPADVPLARMVDPAMNQAMAETALWAVLSLHRGFFELAAAQREAHWRSLIQRRADEVPVAVLGLGQMGRAVAQRLSHNGYRVTGWSTSPSPVAGIASFAGRDALPEVLASAEIVINLLPLTPATTALFDRSTLAEMRRGASLVNLARGAHVVDADLLDALDSGQLQHAVLDVFDVEPLPVGHRFWSHPQVTVLPHAAAQTDPRSAAQIAAANVRALRAGAPLHHLVNRQRGY
ncbi:MAG TPA: glyoxylate/hydroxypyruvate reductase A [Albitalea sp.]|nr:glyoxylate/hydroxypyruvate reductase A [Albitalea sp.]